MSYQAGPIEELLQYKKAALRDQRRDSRIRSSIENTLEFLSTRSFINKFDSSAAISDPSMHSKEYVDYKMTYPQSSYPEMSNDRTARYSEPFRNNKINYPPRSYPAMSNASTARNSEAFTIDKMAYQQSSYPVPNEIPILKRQLSFEKHDIESRSMSLDDHKTEHHDHDGPTPTYLTVKQRLKHFTLAWYAMTMSTGGVAFTLSVLPNRFEGLTALGTGIFVVNLFLFTFVTTAQITRFIMHPGTLTHSLTNPHEGFFFATFWLTLATMLTNSTAYGIPNTGPWLITALRIAFWVYTFCATCVAIFYYHVLFTVKALVITNVLPGWVLPVFPAMLVGTLASAISKTQRPEHALPMLITGLSFQGLGMILSIGMYGIYFGRLMTSGLPADMSRPAMFIAVGPPSFTALAFLGMAQDIKVLKIFGGYTTLTGIENQALIPDVLQLLAILTAIFLWVLSFWFFGIALVATFEAIHRNDFHLNWYAYVFPNVGFTIATIQIGNKLESSGIQLVGSAMGTILFFLWILIVICHVKAIAQHKICWPGKDEDAH